MIKLRIDRAEQVLEELESVEESMSSDNVTVISWDDFNEMVLFAGKYLGDIGKHEYPNVVVEDEKAFDEFHWQCVDIGRYDDGDYL